MPLLFLVAAAAAAAVFTAQAAQPPTLRSRIDLVQVDVVVADEKGSPVRGLTAGDFRLFDRRQPQTIATFEEISHEHAGAGGLAFTPSLARDVADNRTARANRLVVLVIDDLHIYRGRTDRAKDIARAVLTDLGPQASMAVLFTSGEHNTHVTEDRSLLIAAVETLNGRQSFRRPHQAIDAQRTGFVDPGATTETRLGVIQRSQDTSLQQFFDNMAQYNTLRDAARILGAGDARRKAFVLLSEGIGKDLTGLFDGETSPCCSLCTCYHDLALIEMMDSMRQSNIATYAIDPRGHVPPQQLALEAFPSTVTGLGDDPASGGFRWNNPIRHAQDGLRIMAAASGGFAVTDTNSFTSGLDQIIADLDHYYLLGFYPDESGGKGFRPLDVRILSHPEWTLRFRRGYQAGGPHVNPEDTDPFAGLSAGILPKTELPLRLTAIPFPASGGRVRVALALEVSGPRRDLEEGDGRVRDTLKYEVLVVDAKRERVTSVAGVEARITLSPGATDPRRPDTVSYQVDETIDIAPGRYQIRVSARSAKLSRGGSVYLDVTVTDFRTERLALSGLAVGYASGPRVPAAPPRSGPRRRSPLPFPPSLDREFTSGDTLRLYFEVARRTPAAAVRTTAAIVDRNDRIVGSVDGEVPANGSGMVDVALPLSTVAPGPYRLRVQANDGRMTAQREIGFVVVPEEGSNVRESGCRLLDALWIRSPQLR